MKSLLFSGPLPINVIGSKVLLTSGSITSAVDRLESQGLLERQPHPTDRRAFLVHLTQAGEALIKPASRSHARTMADVVSVLTEAEQIELVRLMKKIGKHAMSAYRPDVISLPTRVNRLSSGATKALHKKRAVACR